MATAPEDIKDDQIDPNAEPVGDDQQQNDEGNGDDSPYAPLAKDMGWVPKDQWTGAEEEWKPAETFIRDGRDIQRETSRELKSVRSQLDTIARTSASIVEQQVNEKVDHLTKQYTKAVEDGDPAAAFKLSREIDTAMASAQPAATAPAPEAQDFASRHSNWFTKPGHEYATARAIELSKMFASQGYTDPGVQLRLVEQRMKEEMPQLFKPGMNGSKAAPGVNAPGSRSAGPSNRQKGFSDMPKAAQDIARDMAERLGIKTEDYARNYFANLEGKA